MAAMRAVYGSAGQGHQAAALSSRQFFSLLSQVSTEPGDSLPSPVVTFSAPQKAIGQCFQVPPHKDGQCLSREAGLQPVPHKGPRLWS